MVRKTHLKWILIHIFRYLQLIQERFNKYTASQKFDSIRISVIRKNICKPEISKEIHLFFESI